MEKGWGDEKGLSVHHGGFAHKGIQEKTSEGMFQWPLEDAEICQTIPGTLIWCQPGGRSKIYTHQNEVFSSLAVCPSAPPPHKMFSPIGQKFSSYCHVLLN